MIEYRVIRSMKRAEDTEVILNDLAKKGWKLLCCYCVDWFVLEREKLSIFKSMKKNEMTKIDWKIYSEGYKDGFKTGFDVASNMKEGENK